MIECRIMSIPIVNAKSGKPEYVLSMLHLVDYFLQIFHQNDFSDDMWNRITNLLLDKTSRLHSDKLYEFPSKANITLDPVYTIDEHATILDAAQLMNEKKCHRVVVTNKKGELVNLITQSRIIQFLNVNVDKLPNSSKTISELGLGTRNHLKWISEDKSAYEAFLQMEQEGVLALPIVNANGKLVGNISANDLKLIGFDGKFWNLLGKPLREYMAQLISQPETKIRSHVFALLQEDNQPPVVVKCKESHTLGFVIRMVNFYRVHRMYIINEVGVPIGVISLTDILKEIVPKGERK